MPTLIRIKEKGLDFRDGSLGSPGLATLLKFYDDEAIFPAVATSPCDCVHDWYN
jgi:hypothetical protein